jgi:hypothetical protein
MLWIMIIHHLGPATTIHFVNDNDNPPLSPIITSSYG